MLLVLLVGALVLAHGSSADDPDDPQPVGSRDKQDPRLDSQFTKSMHLYLIKVFSRKMRIMLRLSVSHLQTESYFRMFHH